MATERKPDTWHGRRQRRRPKLRDTTFEPPGNHGNSNGIHDNGIHSNGDTSGRSDDVIGVVTRSRSRRLRAGEGQEKVTPSPSVSPPSKLLPREDRREGKDGREGTPGTDRGMEGTPGTDRGMEGIPGTDRGMEGRRSLDGGLPSYLRTAGSRTDRGSVPRRAGRRCVSDLGLVKARPSRTAALLQNPAISRHISRMMGLREQDADKVVNTFDDTFKVVHGLPVKSRTTPDLNCSLNFEPGTFLNDNDRKCEDLGAMRMRAEASRRSMRERPRSCSLEIEKDWSTDSCPKCVQERLRNNQGRGTPCTHVRPAIQSQAGILSRDKKPGQSQRETASHDKTDFSRANSLRASTNSLPKVVPKVTGSVGFSIPSYQEFKRMRQAAKLPSSTLDILPSCIEESPFEGEESRASDVIIKPESPKPDTSHENNVKLIISQSKSEPDLSSLHGDQSESGDSSSSRSSLQSESPDSDHVSDHVYEEVEEKPKPPLRTRSQKQKKVSDINNEPKSNRKKASADLSSRGTVTVKTRGAAAREASVREAAAREATVREAAGREAGEDEAPRPIPPKRTRRILRPTPSLSPKPSRKAHTDARNNFCDKTFDEDRSTSTCTTTESASSARSRSGGQRSKDSGVKVGRGDLQKSDTVTSDLEVESFEEDLYEPIMSNLDTDGRTVLRSTSDVSDIRAEENRKKSTRNSRIKQYKSDPFSGGQRSARSVPPGVETVRECTEDRKNSTKKQVMSFLASKNADVTSSSDSSTGRRSGSRSSSIDSSYEEIEYLEVEATKTSNPINNNHDNKTNPAHHIYETIPAEKIKGVPCTDCSKLVPPSECEPINDGDELSINLCAAPPLCKKCTSRRVERKEALQEIVNTEVRYSKDLKVIKQEFYEPMKNSGLLTTEQLQTVFINLDELMAITDHFSGQLLDALGQATDQGDEDYVTVNIGKLFCEASSMLLAFETYCVNQSAAPILLEQLSAEKELLRIFLDVSQKENVALRKMDLKSFLMLPVQRVMKYPLLLSRVLKVTPAFHEDREFIKTAKTKIENILGHINSNTKGSMTARIRRRLSSVTRRSSSVDSASSIETHKVALEMLGWSRNEAGFVMTGRLSLAVPSDHTWIQKRGRNLKFAHVQALLVTRGRGPRCDLFSDRLTFLSKQNQVKDSALVLVKEKMGKYVPVREPLNLDRCVVSMDTSYREAFEVYEANGDMYLFKGDDLRDTETWWRNLRFQAKDRGKWRKRRNGLANIMIQTQN